MEDILFDLYYKQAHRNEELELTIEELQTELKYRKNENKNLQSCLKIAENDYKKCYAENIRLAEENNKLQCDINDLQQSVNEIKLLNNQIDNLITENKQLKLRNKMLTKIGLNSIYGIHCCKNHCVYTDIDSIKSESEDNE